jgi:RNA polymerase sigma-70 factor (ECF subfamily)
MYDEERLVDLMVQYQAGHIEAFEEFYRIVKPRLDKFLTVKTLNRPLTEELLQETFLQIHRSRQTYYPGRPVTPWIFSIAHHVYLNDRRSRIKRISREEAIEDHIADLPVPSNLEAEVEIEGLKKAMVELPPEQRESILLHHYWGFSFREIGRTLGIQTITAKLRAHRGLLKLRENLGIKNQVTGNQRNAN